MKTQNDEFLEKIIAGLALSYERLIEFKIYKKSKIVVMRDGKIVHLDPLEAKKELELAKAANKDVIK